MISVKKKIKLFYWCHTSIPYFFLMVILNDKATGATNNGIQRIDSAPGEHISKIGRKGFSPSDFEMVIA